MTHIHWHDGKQHDGKQHDGKQHCAFRNLLFLICNFNMHLS
jgi:uracil-DNA glycosylase